MNYPLIFYVDSLPGTSKGVAQGPVIRILKSKRDDEGIRQHELTHVKQWFISLGLHSFLYLLIPEYKLWSEVEAYKVQARYYEDDRLPIFANMISTKYELAITPESALQLLKE